MTTATASGWSGLVNDVHSTTYETVGEKPSFLGRAALKMRKRGAADTANDAGGTAQTKHVQVQAVTGGDLGGARVINAAAVIVQAQDATSLAQIFDTPINHAYVADSSGNGGPALAAGTPNA